jgi:hypothetical protein
MKHVSRLGFTLLLAILWNGCSEDPVDLSAKSSGSTSTGTGKTKTTTVAAPVVTTGTPTQTSVVLTVTAGATGAPAGFSLQWMTAEALAANGGIWYESADSSLCKASFSGNANLSRYNLAAGESVSVTVGEFLFDNGASSNCIDALTCGSTYVFRVFAHATNTLYRSPFTADVSCSTLPCGSTGGCTLTQGFWKTHGTAPTGNNTNVWPATGLTLGGVAYTDVELQAILDKPAQGNGLIAMAHQLIAAKLNVANGADDSAVAASIAAADALIGSLVVPPVGSGSLPSSATSALTGALATYNEGGSGPGHCD